MLDLKLEFDEQQQALYDKWSKDDIYKAYLAANSHLKDVRDSVRKLNVLVAGAKYDEQRCFRQLVMSVIPNITTKDLDTFFSLEYKIVYIQKGFIGIQIIDDIFYVAYLYKANHFGTARAIVKYLIGKEVYYSVYNGVDHYKNNSIHNNLDEDDVFRLVL